MEIYFKFKQQVFIKEVAECKPHCSWSNTHQHRELISRNEYLPLWGSQPLGSWTQITSSCTFFTSGIVSYKCVMFKTIILWTRVGVCLVDWKEDRTIIKKSLQCVHILLGAKSLQSRPTLCDPRDGSPPGSPPSLGFSRQEHWSGLSFPSPMHESEKWK